MLEATTTLAQGGASFGGFTLVDGSEPSEPQLLGNLVGNAITNVELRGRVAFVTDGAGKLSSVSLRNLKYPREVGFLGDTGSVRRIKLRGKRAYTIGDRGTLQIFDLADGRNSVLLNKLDFDEFIANVQTWRQSVAARRNKPRLLPHVR